MNVELQLHGDVVLHEPRDAIVVLGCERDGRQRDGLLWIIGAAGGREHRSAIAGVTEGKQRERSFILQELRYFFLELALLIAPLPGFFRSGRRLFAACARRSWRPQTERRPPRRRRSCFFGQLGIRVAAARSSGLHCQFPGFRRHYDLAFQFALILFEIRLGADDGQYRLAGYGSVGTGGPSQRNTDERLILRLNQVRFKMFVCPTAAEGAPFFFLGGKAILGHALHDPIRGGLVIGRAGEARTVYVRQVKHVIHHFRVFESFGLDAVDHRKIDLLGCEKQQRNAGGGNGQ